MVIFILLGVQCHQKKVINKFFALLWAKPGIRQALWKSFTCWHNRAVQWEFCFVLFFCGQTNSPLHGLCNFADLLQAQKQFLFFKVHMWIRIHISVFANKPLGLSVLFFSWCYLLFSVLIPHSGQFTLTLWLYFEHYCNTLTQEHKELGLSDLVT